MSVLCDYDAVVIGCTGSRSGLAPKLSPRLFLAAAVYDISTSRKTPPKPKFEHAHGENLVVCLYTMPT
jgi:hypothetical protein